MKTMKHVRFALQENIASNIVFVDGIARCGKSIFSNVLPTLYGTEQLRFFTLLEHIVPALSLGAIEIELAKSSVRTLMNEVAYDTLLSRNANFRPDDQTSVLNYYDPKLYIQRLVRQEGDEVVEELRKRERMFPFQTHDMMVNLEDMDKLDIDYKMIHIYRHPVDNIYSWYTRGWGDRYLADPRSFTLSIEFEGKVLPWYCAGYEAEWLRLNPTERCVRTGLDLIKRSANQEKKARFPERIHTITFEDFVQNTEFEMQRITEFLGRASNAWTKQFLIKSRCPRVLDPKDRVRKLEEFRGMISADLFDVLLEFSSRYEDALYGLKV